jgi:nucleotide-binding universal stress UspA family protein
LALELAVFLLETQIGSVSLSSDARTTPGFPERARAVGTARESTELMKRILTCLDGSQRAPYVLATAVTLARSMGAKLRLFRAVSIPSEVPPRLYSVSPNDLPGILLESAKSELSELARDVPPELIDGLEVHIGSPWDAICAAAHSTDADLVVIGSHGYGALDRVLGTTAAKVVNHVDRSVLVVRSKGGPAAV